jgi:hypothetical protein
VIEDRPEVTAEVARRARAGLQRYS